MTNDRVEEESDVDDGIPSVERFSMEEIPAVIMLGICRQLLQQSFPPKSATRSIADEEILPYRSNVLKSLETLLKSLPDSDYSSHFRGRIFSFLAPKLWDVFRVGSKDQPSPKESPLIVARSIDCFASSCWSRMKFQDIEESSKVGSDALSQTLLFQVDLTKQPAWTVREAAAKAASKFVQCADFDSLQRRQAVSTLVDIAGIALKDRRFWKVRLGGLDILLSLVLRAENVSSSAVVERGMSETDQTKQLILEIILPYKESIQDRAKRSLNDSEAKITAQATKVLGIISTWP
uniref:HEAT repeat-containing protein 1 n=1 Tax=Pseudo-nitzschia delicatissima TaxID=44447 RepID=A0A7S0TDY8_9STRA|mmetsp:Transcript_881/g.2059  ORF Transcript_881/g.2059 Transcript_881/m.2059 type:complete len:292 (+) Transcript_881:2-877(+)